MALLRAPGYLAASSDAVSVQPWTLQNGHGAIELGSQYDLFDPSASLTIGVHAVVGQRTVRQQCGLDPNDELALALLWSSTATRIRGASTLWRLPSALDEVEADLSLELSGSQIGGVLDLRCVLVLAGVVHPPSATVANNLGSILWEAPRHRVALEGLGGRFPTELCEFGVGNPFPPRAVWILDWDSGDLSLPALGSVRLYLNQSHPANAALTSLDAGAPGPTLRDALRYDIARALIRGALANEAFVQGSEVYEPGSIGDALRRLCSHVLFPYQSLEGLASRIERDPSRFDADLQAALGIFRA